MSAASIAAWLWESESVGAKVARSALAPASALYGMGISRRNARFDRVPDAHAAAGARRPLLPCISVGNLTVGGTGKTPVAAWCAQRLKSKGARPALIMRGYGDDEWRVHMLLNPGVPVFVAPERNDGMLVARTKGADCAVLDDAFQHRQALRTADLVLLSADRWRGRARLLPAGPFREPLTALGRADVIVITAKAADTDRIEALERVIERTVPGKPVAVIRLVLGELRLAATIPDIDASGKAHAKAPDPTGLLTRSLASMDGRRLVAVSGIGDPVSFRAQLAASGAELTAVAFPDHHAFSSSDAAELARTAAGTDGVVCTLKDAVKLGRVWPRVAPPLWYVSQSVVVERGAPALDRALARVLEARVATAPTAG